MKKTLSITILAILTCVCILFAFAGCADQNDIDDSVNTAITPISEQFTDIEDSISDLETELSTLETELNGKDDELNTAIEAQKAALEKVKTDLTAAYNNAISTAINDNNGNINTKIANDIAAAKTELQGKIDTINGEITQIKADITALNTTVGELQGKIDELEQENTDLKNQIDEMIALYCSTGIHGWNSGTCKYCETCYYEITDTTATLDFPIYVTGEEITAVTQKIFTNTITSVTVTRELTKEELTAFESGISQNSLISINGEEYRAVVDATGLTTATNLEGNPTIKVLKDFTADSTIYSYGSYTLDLNGKKIASNADYALYIIGGSVTIRDSVGTGEVLKDIDGTGTLTIEGGSYYYVNCDNLIVKDGDFYCLLVTANQTATISGGSFEHIFIYSRAGTLDGILEEGYCYYDEEGKVVDTSNIQVDTTDNFYKLYNVTVGEIQQTA